MYFVLFLSAEAMYSSKLDSLRRTLNSGLEDSLYFETIIDISSIFNELNPDSTLYYLNKAYERDPNNYYKNLLDLNKAGAYQRQGKYTKAIELITSAKTYFEEVNDKKQITKIDGRLGYLYLDMEQIEKSGKYFNKAKENLDKYVPYDEQIAILINYSRYLEAIGKIDSALQIRYKVIEWSNSESNYNLLSLNYLSVANNYLQMSKLDSAKKYFKYSNDLTDSISEKFRAMVHLNYGRFMGMNGNLNACVELTKKAINFFKKSEPEGLISVYINLSYAFELMSQYDSALYYSKKLQTLTDSLRNVKMLTEIAKIEAIKDNQIKDQKIKNLEKEKVAAKKFNYAIIAIVLLTIILLFISIRALKSQKKSNQNLQKLNTELDSKNKMLKESESNLRSLNQTKDKLFSIVAHDLRNPVNSIDRGLEFLNESFDILDEEDLKEIISETSDGAKSLNTLLENLLNWSRSQRDLIKIDKEKFSLNQLISINLDLFKNAANEKDISLEFEGQDTDIFSDQNLVNNILRNLINNAIKFTPNNGKINIFIEEEEEKIILNVADNGVGIEKDRLDTLFNVVQNTSKMGTGGERGTGLGLVLCYEFAIKIGADLKVKSEIGKGSTFSLELPKE
jgi:signal transduction histidine kinase